MNLRARLTEIIELLDQHPNIETKKYAPALTKAIDGFEEKFADALKAKDADKKWEAMRSRLVKLAPEVLGAEVRAMEEKALLAFCKFLGMKSVKATKQLTLRGNAEAKAVKKIKEISKQLH